MKLVRIILVLAILVCLLPLASVVLAGWIANANGCTLHEGFANSCVIGGVDWGETLYGMEVMGWLMLATLPIAVILIAAWVIAEIVNAVRRRRSPVKP
jgi:TRAP-type C4-dicarboxylate transport system permease small subunit